MSSKSVESARAPRVRSDRSPLGEMAGTMDEADQQVGRLRNVGPERSASALPSKPAVPSIGDCVRLSGAHAREASSFRNTCPAFDVGS
jgi:hypothetical protein